MERNLGSSAELIMTKYPGAPQPLLLGRTINRREIDVPAYTPEKCEVDERSHAESALRLENEIKEGFCSP
jgi:hypothetical protein